MRLIKFDKRDLAKKSAGRYWRALLVKKSPRNIEEVITLVFYNSKGFLLCPPFYVSHLCKALYGLGIFVLQQTSAKPRVGCTKLG